MSDKRKKAPRMDAVFFKLFEREPSKGDLRRFEITEEAIDCVAELGIENTNFDVIAARMGVRRSNLVYYFPQMKDLVDSMVRYIIQTAQTITVKRLENARDLDEQIEAYVGAAFEWAKAFPNHAKTLILYYHLCTHHDAYRVMHGKIRQAGYERILAVLTQGLAGSRIKKRPAAAGALARAIQSIVTSRLIEAFTCVPMPSLDQLEAAVISEISVLVEAFEA